MTFTCFTGQLSSLARTATTGVAACLIGGSTLHSWAGIPARRKPQSDKWVTHPSPAMAERRKNNILYKRLLGVDEMSLLTTDILARLSHVLGVVRTNEVLVDSTVPFGGLSILLIGDFHQFPPVAQLKKALFYRNPVTIDAQIGRHLFEQFRTVVMLNKQMRIQDEIWHGILTRARSGTCSAGDLNVIHQLVLTHSGCNVPDFSIPPWDNAVLITPRNSVRTQWNDTAVRNHCKVHGHVLYVSCADDEINAEPLSHHQRLLVRHLSEEQTGHLCAELPLAIGLKMMITENITTVANIANGSRGVITSIVLDPREDAHVPVQNNGVDIVKLMYPPSFIIIKLDFTELTPLPYSIYKRTKFLYHPPVASSALVIIHL